MGEIVLEVKISGSWRSPTAILKNLVSEFSSIQNSEGILPLELQNEAVFFSKLLSQLPIDLVLKSENGKCLLINISDGHCQVMEKPPVIASAKSRD
jgi:hypothetical protein